MNVPVDRLRLYSCEDIRQGSFCSRIFAGNNAVVAIKIAM